MGGLQKASGIKCGGGTQWLTLTGGVLAEGKALRVLYIKHLKGTEKILTVRITDWMAVVKGY